MSRNYTARNVLEAVRGSEGNVSTVAKNLECEWHTARKYIDKWQVTQQALKNEEEKILDICESELKKQIKKGERWAIKFMLSTKGKRRGYGYTEDPPDATDIAGIAKILQGNYEAR